MIKNLIFSISILIFLVVPASADQAVITNGSVHLGAVTLSSASWNINGPNFSAYGYGDRGNNESTFTLYSTDYLGTAGVFWNGVNYPNGDIRLTTTFSFSNLGINAPFTMTGRVTGVSQSGLVLSVDFSGQGIATYNGRETVYTFTEVPEPTSLLLLASGLCYLWRKRIV